MAGFRCFQVVSGWFQLLSAGFSWFQLASDGFRWFQMVSGGFRLFLVLVSIINDFTMHLILSKLFRSQKYREEKQ